MAKPTTLLLTSLVLWGCTVDDRVLMECGDDAGFEAGAGGSTASSAGRGGRGGSAGSKGGGAEGGSDPGNVPCPDLDLNSIPDCAETLVLNGDFRSDDEHWTAEGGVDMSWSAVDGQTLDGSGSLLVTNEFEAQEEGFTMKAATQCIPITGSKTYVLRAQAHIEGEEVTGFAQIGAWLYDKDDCTGRVDLWLTPQVGTIQRWNLLSGSFSAPGTTSSVLIRLGVVKKFTDAPVTFRFDNVLLRPQ